MKVIVCGGRKYSNEYKLFSQLDRLHSENCFTLLVSGAQRGADRLAERWAKDRGIPTVQYEAAWDLYGNAAGPLRNQKMLDEEHPDLVVAFPGHTGTLDMTTRARKAGVRVIEIS